MGSRGKGFGTCRIAIGREKMERYIQDSSAAKMGGARERVADGPPPLVSMHGPLVSIVILTEQPPGKELSRNQVLEIS